MRWKEIFCSRNRKITELNHSNENEHCAVCMHILDALQQQCTKHESINKSREKIHNKHVTQKHSHSHGHTHICQTKINFYVLGYCCVCFVYVYLLRDYDRSKRNIEKYKTKSSIIYSMDYPMAMPMVPSVQWLFLLFGLFIVRQNWRLHV